jgi:hypothetical protein
MKNVGIFGLFDSHLKYLVAIWYNLWSVGICTYAFFHVLVCFTEKNLATLDGSPVDAFVFV